MRELDESNLQVAGKETKSPSRALGLCHTGRESWGQAGAGNAQPGPRTCWWWAAPGSEGGHPGALEEAEVGVEGSWRAGSTVSILTLGKKTTISLASSRPNSLPFPRAQTASALSAHHGLHTFRVYTVQVFWAKPMLGARREIARLVGRWRWSLHPLHPGPSPPQGLPAPFPTTDTRLLA